MSGRKVAFIGLGTMGYPMAGHLVRNGHTVAVYNRTSEKSLRWQAEHGGTAASTPQEAARDADIVFSCVGADDDLREVTIGPGGAFSGMKPGSIFVDHTTTSAEGAPELLERARELGIEFLDAPVSGGQSGAENGVLTVMVGGNEEAYETARPVIESFAARIERMGPCGYGQLAKMVNQICIAGVLQGLSEGLHFAMKANLDIEKLISVISKGAAQSWQMENRYKTMVEGKFDFGFAVDWMRKDLAIALAEAERNGAKLPVTRIIDEYYAEVQRMGGNRWDTSSLIARL